MDQTLVWRELSNFLVDGLQIVAIGFHRYETLLEPRREDRAAAASVLEIEPAVVQKRPKHRDRFLIEVGLIANSEADESLSNEEVSQFTTSVELL
jgi:hypothetical protein